MACRRHRFRVQGENDIVFRQLKLGEKVDAPDAASLPLDLAVALLQEFGGSFGLADVVLVTDIYAASERPVPGVDGSTVAAAIRRHGHDEVHYEADKAKLPERLREWIEPGSIVLTLGAGDVWRAGDTLIKRSKIKSAGGSR